jgi:hypothetical protein
MHVKAQSDRFFLRGGICLRFFSHCLKKRRTCTRLEFCGDEECQQDRAGDSAFAGLRLPAPTSTRKCPHGVDHKHNMP